MVTSVVLWTFVVVGACLSALVLCCDVIEHEESHVCGARADGDVMIGLLLPCHGSIKNLATRTRDTERYQCSDFEPGLFMRSLAAIYAIEEVNAAGILPVVLGYIMCDTCSHPSKALQNVELLLRRNHTLHPQCHYPDYRPEIKAILGARYSETSISVAKLLSVHMIPLLSSTSSSPALSDKLRHAVFLRTVPSDVHQTRALTQLISYFSWNWVGVVYRDDAYGTAALQSFLQDAQRANVCVAYQEVLPFEFDPNGPELQRVARKIRTSSAKVVLLILKGSQVEAIFKEMIKTNTKKVWLASDSWAVNGLLAHMEDINQVGDILGFMFIKGKNESFDNYLRNLSTPQRGYNHFIEEYKNLRFNCTPECFEDNPPSHCPSPELLKLKSRACVSSDPQAQNDDYLVKTLDTGEAFLERAGVWAVAHALKKVLQCNSSECTGQTDFPPWKLLKELKRVNFEYENQTFYFDENGDSLNGYDIIMWKKDGDHRTFNKIGRYYALDGLIKIEETNLAWFSTNNATVPVCRCSPQCSPGSFKKILNVSCCYSCVECVEGTFTDGVDHEECKSCPNGTWCLKGADHCERRQDSYLSWGDAHPIVIMVATGVGFLTLLVIFILFWIYRNSSAMERADVSISIVMMVGLLVSFASVICFIGRPSIHLCRARQVMYALGFTTCVSCVLVKAYHTFLEYVPLRQELHSRLKKLYQRAAIISVLTILQGIICCLWLIFDSPDVAPPNLSPLNLKKVIRCHEGPKLIGFGIMLSYIAFLALVGFFLAFKGRNVPQVFSETGYIIFSMVMYLFVWVCFVPVYITTKEERTAVQASAILISNYGIIFCHLIPKCYEAIWGPNTDTMERFYSRMKGVGHRTNPTVNTIALPHIDIPLIHTVPENINNPSLVNDSSPGQNDDPSVPDDTDSPDPVFIRSCQSLKYRRLSSKRRVSLRSKSFCSRMRGVTHRTQPTENPVPLPHIDVDTVPENINNPSLVNDSRPGQNDESSIPDDTDSPDPVFTRTFQSLRYRRLSSKRRVRLRSNSF